MTHRIHKKKKEEEEEALSALFFPPPPLCDDKIRYNSPFELSILYIETHMLVFFTYLT